MLSKPPTWIPRILVCTNYNNNIIISNNDKTNWKLCKYTQLMNIYTIRNSPLHFVPVNNSNIILSKIDKIFFQKNNLSAFKYINFKIVYFLIISMDLKFDSKKHFI